MTDEERLAGLRACEEAVAAAEDHRTQTVEASRDLIDRYHWALRVALDARADRRPLGERDQELETEGAHASDQIDMAAQAVALARVALGAEIARLCDGPVWKVGDKMHSVTGADLIVASIYEPVADRSLSEVTFTADGGGVEKSLHPWTLDAQGRPEKDGLPPVRYERWWASGLRMAGRVHPISRQIVNLD